MGLFETISNVFFEEETPIQPTRTTPKVNTAQTSRSSAMPGATQSPQASAALDENIYKKFCSSLEEALDQANLPGFDFFEFHQLYKRFLDDGKSEQDALKNALTSSETMRVDKNKLISNFHHYKKVLDEQKDLFQNDLKDFSANNIDKPKKEYTRIQNGILEKENLIIQYTQDILDLKNELAGLDVDVVKAQEQIEKVQLAFQKAYDTVIEDFNALNVKLKSV